MIFLRGSARWSFTSRYTKACLPLPTPWSALTQALLFHQLLSASPTRFIGLPPPETFAQLSRRPTVRLNTSRSGVESLSGQK